MSENHNEEEYPCHEQPGTFKRTDLCDKWKMHPAMEGHSFVKRCNSCKYYGIVD